LIFPGVLSAPWRTIYADPADTLLAERNKAAYLFFRRLREPPDDGLTTWQRFVEAEPPSQRAELVGAGNYRRRSSPHATGLYGEYVEEVYLGRSLGANGAHKDLLEWLNSRARYEVMKAAIVLEETLDAPYFWSLARDDSDTARLRYSKSIEQKYKAVMEVQQAAARFAVLTPLCSDPLPDDEFWEAIDSIDKKEARLLDSYAWYQQRASGSTRQCSTKKEPPPPAT
jgi:hypothetical protein